MDLAGRVDGVVVMIGFELVVGWLAAYAWGKARRVAGGADAEVDRVFDAGMARLHDLVSARLGPDPALAKLEAEAGQAAATTAAEVVVSDRTRQRVELAIADVADTDPSFATALDTLVAQLRQAQAPTAGSISVSHSGPATATGGGVAISGAVGGDVTAGGR
ncbi:chromosome partitioning protein [Micromonospora sp. NPDC048999]|uniref:chromosome partitioning protein n=1 Tax=Micromonospora sp. NPDC048999 TaxID=3155391 RepID=UPI00340A2639